jgi:hypothetical protein
VKGEIYAQIVVILIKDGSNDEVDGGGDEAVDAGGPEL